jgi:NTP pyrophosphatase (non-canonical NTP hydrolase)
MTPNEYQRAALRTEPTFSAYCASRERSDDSLLIRLEHAGYGFATEAGEFLDALKKHKFYGKPLDQTNMAEEVGDLLWYAAIACDALGLDMSSVMATNIAKLKARFPEKFTEAAANNRDLDAERKVLEGT